ncbi:hypothetical protein AYO21_00782 [Fonsecaea monophora]|uniref:Solute carrier family 40 member n=1 Tax=Fonsecaea monophora TaxID=254056 RepID=A0A177FLZ6_9EURO|nr:hypothetical protein AYO21_00782 [Fonsecaea monophora]OAG44821.1 hypothetical protein AYO21_00782 [Fonsecaea monophora]
MPTLLQGAVQKTIFATLVVLACAEKLCSVMNLVSVEKDWCVVVAGNNQAALRRLNAQMRRIDLLCKLLGPLFIASVDTASTRVAIIVNFAMNLLSVPIEYFAIARVYHEVPALQEPKTAARSEDSLEPKPFLRRAWNSLMYMSTKSVADCGLYFRHTVFLPSAAGALLYLTVLNFGGQMVTFLLASGYKSGVIGVARTLSVSFEVLATWFAPWLIAKIGPVRAGLWLSTLQVFPLIGGTIAFILLKPSALSATALVVGTIVSRLGLRGFDLSTQLLVQEVSFSCAFQLKC